MKLSPQIIFCYIIFKVSFCSSCNCQNNESLKLINVESNLKRMEIIGLTQFTNKVRYVSLEKNENYPLGFIYQMDFFENLILVTDMNICLLYDTEGHFISKIGNKGRGPGEYPGIINIGFGKNKNIYLSASNTLYEYNRNGIFIEKYINSLLINNVYYIPNWVSISDSLFFGHVVNLNGDTGYKSLIINKRGNVKNSFRNYIFYSKAGVGGTEEWPAHIYSFGDDMYYKEFSNDTVFRLTDLKNLIAKYVIDLGKYKEPVSYRENHTGDDKLKYIYVPSVFQTKNYLFLDCELGNYFPARRLTPIATPVQTIKPLWYNTRHALAVYNKKSGELVFCKPTSTDNQLFTSGIYNDIDAGPRFFPTKMVNDSTMVMAFTANQFKNHVASDDFKNSVPKYTDKKNQLMKFAEGLTEYDNPVMMFVTFNK